MKKRILLITLIGMSFGIKAQNTLPVTGNIGIGTVSPQEDLHINHNDFTNILLSNSHPSKGENIVLKFLTTKLFSELNYSRHAIWFGNLDNEQSGAIKYQHSWNYQDSNFMSFHTAGQERFRVDENGNVGIGTTTTGSHKLAVEGSIGAREIKVEANGWSDFVFENNYDLPTLIEVEKHIKEKGHLKDIPSAKEVEKNGIFLGEMNSKLLQKIEELTLYTIAQEKKIEKVEKENKSLTTNFLELRIRLEKLENK